MGVKISQFELLDKEITAAEEKDYIFIPVIHQIDNASDEKFNNYKFQLSQLTLATEFNSNKTQTDSDIKDLRENKQDKNLGEGNENKVLITDSDSIITTSEITTSELNCLSGLATNINDLLDLKANAEHVHEIEDVNGLSELINKELSEVEERVATLEKNQLSKTDVVNTVFPSYKKFLHKKIKNLGKVMILHDSFISISAAESGWWQPFVAGGQIPHIPLTLGLNFFNKDNSVYRGPVWWQEGGNSCYGAWVNGSFFVKKGSILDFEGGNSKIGDIYIFPTGDNIESIDEDRLITILNVTNKFNNCRNVNEIKNVDSKYITNFGNVEWVEPLDLLEDGTRFMYNNDSLYFFRINSLPSMVIGTEAFRTCDRLEEFDTLLSSLTDGTNMFRDCPKLKDFESDLSSLEIGLEMFRGSAISTWKIPMNKLKDGTRMFYEAKKLETFDCNLPLATDITRMFYSCSGLKTFKSDLSSIRPIINSNGTYKTSHYLDAFYGCDSLEEFNCSLKNIEDGTRMFYNNRKLKTFSSDLSELTNGTEMFRNCVGLKEFNNDFPKLTNGTRMFCDCSNLETFGNMDLSSLSDGNNMFRNCKNLREFKSPLPSLTNGHDMLTLCKLDLASAQLIAESLPTLTTKKGFNLGVDKTLKNTAEITEIIEKIKGKNWSLSVHYN